MFAPDPGGPDIFEVAGEAAAAVARRAIATIPGTLPDDPAERRAACEALGPDSEGVFSD